MEFAWGYPHGGEDAADSPFWYLTAPSAWHAEALGAAIRDRGVLVRCLIELWAEGERVEDLVATLRRDPERTDAMKRRVPCWRDADLTAGPGGDPNAGSFKFYIDSFGRTISLKEQLALMDAFAFLELPGRVDLASPDAVLCAFEACADPERTGGGTGPRWSLGHALAAPGRAAFWQRFALTRRGYLGPTSMDHELAAVMANLGRVGANDLVFDPFAGTGSILVACAAQGAHTFGGDIDWRVILGVGPAGTAPAQSGPGRGFTAPGGQGNGASGGGEGGEGGGMRKVDVWTNFDDYGLARPVGLLRCDASRLPFRGELRGLFDAVVCDPPYGVRAGGRKSGGSEKLRRRREGQEQRGPESRERSRERAFKDAHIPSTGAYALSECLCDLLDLAARHLRMGGRLVYFFPTTNGIFDAALPSHPCLAVVGTCEQHLSHHWGRTLVTMEKVGAWDARMALANRQALLTEGSNLRQMDRLHDIVFKFIQENGEGARPKRIAKHRGKRV